MFMKAVIVADDGRSIPIMTMGPICIAPELKRKGYGKILLDYSLEKAKELMGKADLNKQVNLVFVTMVWKKGMMLHSFYVKN